MPTTQQTTQLSQAQRLIQAGKLADAQKLLQKLVRQNRTLVGGFELLGRIASLRRQDEQALEYYKQCRRLAPQSPRYAYYIARSLTALGRMAESLQWYDQALAGEANEREVLTWKAKVLETMGDARAALALTQPLLDADEAPALAVITHVRALQRQGEHEQAIELAEATAANETTGPPERSTLLYAAAKSRERLGRLDEAFETYGRANAVLAKPVEPAAIDRPLEAMLQVFTAQAARAFPRAGNASKRPVFIVGMPRSGTTLLEQIIDAHPQAQGVGEIPDIELIAAGLGQRLGVKQGFPAALARVTGPVLSEAAKAYLSRLQRLAPNASRVVNKSLLNWYNLGLISLLFPEAYFVDCRRDPLDTCASCYMSELDPRRYPFANDLASLGRTYRAYERLMGHWDEVLEVKILRVQYERVVADLEGEARRLIDFLDLPWDEACVRFHESGRTALTLSYDQVQQPIYASSVGRGEKFGKHLEPLRAALAEAGPREETS